MQVSSLPVYPKCEKLVYALFEMVDRFPKKDKYSLGDKLKDRALEMFSYIAQANRASGFEERNERLSDFLENFEIIKCLIRFSHTRKNISTAQLANLSLTINEIEKQVYAWKRSSSRLK